MALTLSCYHRKDPPHQNRSMYVSFFLRVGVSFPQRTPIVTGRWVYAILSWSVTGSVLNLCWLGRSLSPNVVLAACTHSVPNINFSFTPLLVFPFHENLIKPTYCLNTYTHAGDNVLGGEIQRRETFWTLFTAMMRYCVRLPWHTTRVVIGRMYMWRRARIQKKSTGFACDVDHKLPLREMRVPRSPYIHSCI